MLNQAKFGLKLAIILAPKTSTGLATNDLSCLVLLSAAGV